MATLRLHLGTLDRVAKGYPLELYDLESGLRLVPAQGEDSIWLPSDFLDVAKVAAQFKDPLTQAFELRLTGQALFDALHRGKIATVWDAAQAAQPSAVILIEIVDEELQNLPWELISNGVKQYFGRTPGMARFHEEKGLLDESSAWPYRLMVLLGSEGAGPTGGMEELRRLRADLLRYRHSIDLEVCLADSEDSFLRDLSDFQPHFLHYVGHSGTSAKSGLATLMLQGGAELDAQHIATVLNQSRVHPRFVFLNACHTAASAPLALAKAFTSEGVPALLTMQGAIEGDLAGEFAALVYQQIWQGTPLHDVIARARAVLSNAKAPQVWAFPVLSLAVSPEQVCPPRPLLDQERKKHISQCAVFHEVRLFTGRAHESRSLRRAICPVSPSAPSEHLKIITGESKHGKSYLVKRCLEALALGGHDVQYVEMADGREKTWVDVVLNLLRPDVDHGAAPIPTQIADRLRWDVHCILKHGAIRPWDGSKVEGRIEFKPDEQKAEDPAKAVFDAFFHALREASSKHPLLIVLDHFRADPKARPDISPELLRDTLWPKLFEPIMAGALPSVAMILVILTSDAEDTYGLARMVRRDQWLTVKDLDPAKFKDLAAELVGFPADPAVQVLADLVLRNNAGKPLTEALGIFEKVITTIDNAARARVGITE